MIKWHKLLPNRDNDIEWFFICFCLLLLAHVWGF